MTRDPIARFRRWLSHAQRAGIPLAETAALATADATGRPSVRFVLLKQADARGFVFYTNARSRKGKELKQNPLASLAFCWNPLGKQVRVEGPVEVVAAAEADAYWVTRPRDSQLAGLASTQSAELARRSDLLARWRQLRRQYDGQDIPRPAAWIGYRIIPQRIEFWTLRDRRLHDRQLFVRGDNGWKWTLLQP